MRYDGWRLRWCKDDTAMAFHYTVDAEMRFLNELEPAEAAAVGYMIGLTDQAPDPLPTHECYGAEVDLSGLRHEAGFLVPGGVITLFDRSVSPTSEIREGVLHLRVPGCRLEGVYEDELPLLDWLAQFCSDGFLGYVKCEDTDELSFLLYVFDRKLFIVGDAGDTGVALRTGEKRDVRRIRSTTPPPSPDADPPPDRSAS